MADFKGGTTNVILHCKPEKPKGKSQIFKSFSDGFRCFEFEEGGEGNKVIEYGKRKGCVRPKHTQSLCVKSYSNNTTQPTVMIILVSLDKPLHQFEI